MPARVIHLMVRDEHESRRRTLKLVSNPALRLCFCNPGVHRPFWGGMIYSGCFKKPGILMSDVSKESPGIVLIHGDDRSDIFFSPLRKPSIPTNATVKHTPTIVFRCFSFRIQVEQIPNALMIPLSDYPCGVRCAKSFSQAQQNSIFSCFESGLAPKSVIGLNLRILTTKAL